MIYLYIDKNSLKLFFCKKGFLGQFETKFFEKHHSSELLVNGRIPNTDLVASAVKEAYTLISQTPLKEKEIFLILPQESFHFLRTEIPTDISDKAIIPFIRDKAQASWDIDVENCFGDYIICENRKQKVLSFYALQKEVIEEFQKAFSLVDLKIKKIFPNTLAYFTLFKKTLRNEKKEHIFYVSYEYNTLNGFLFDSFGLISPKRWIYEITKNQAIEKILNGKVEEMQKNEQIKLHRIILSGIDSDSIRQDMFTKAVGVWTNPLKRIVPDFYQENLKQLIIKENKQFPILNYDACLGSFIFSQEYKDFSFFKRNLIQKKGNNFQIPKLGFPTKDIIIFITSFLLSFGVFIVLSQFHVSFPIPQFNRIISRPTPTIKMTPTLTLTPTPTISIKKESIKIKILNGSGKAGKAGEAKTILKNKGYNEILTDNADNFDYKKTEINARKEKKEAATIIKEDLKENTKTIIIGELRDDEKTDADVIIIIGSDFE